MLNALYTFPDNFDTIKRADKGLTLYLRSGESLSGKLSGWTEDYVVLTELAGREDCDAVIRISDVSALSVAVR